MGDHRFLDAQSLIGFMKDVIELYCNANFEGIPYPADMRSYIEQVEKDLAYEAGSRAQARDRAYFHKLIEESEPRVHAVISASDSSMVLPVKSTYSISRSSFSTIY